MQQISNLYQRFLKLKSLRQELEDSWRECYEYALPQRQGLFGGAQSQIDKLFDGTAPDCVDQLAASVFSELTPPWSQWFNLQTAATIDDEDAQVGQALAKIGQTLANNLNQSTFSVELHQCYLDLVTVGTACLLMEEAKVGERSAFHFTAIPLSQVFVDEGYSGRLDTTFRRFEAPLDVLRQRFERVQNIDLTHLDADKLANVKVSVIECVVPKLNGGYEYTAFVEKDNENIFGADDEHFILKQGVFDTSPFITFRWQKAPAEVYGRSPVMKALPDIKTANKVVELILKNATIVVTGIWQAEDDGVLNPANIRLVPGTIIPKAVGSKGLTPLQSAGNFDVSQLVLSDLRTRIRHALLNDKLGQVDSPKMTATEVLERSAEMVRILGATYGRLQTELLTPLIERALSILRRRGEIPDICLDGRVVKVFYQSPIADSQTKQEASNALNWLNSLSSLGTDASAMIDVAAFSKWLAGKLNVPLEFLKTNGEEK